MRIKIDVLRRALGETKSFYQRFIYETDNNTETVATALTTLNEREQLCDEDGNPARPIKWECSCLQKKCGACAMVINGRPCLACGIKLCDCGETVRLEPLKKFPVTEDLVTDRSIMQENLKTIRLWFNEEAELNEKTVSTAYESSRCLQCGCCLEVCPNFFSGGSFTGMASAIPLSRLIAELPQKKEALKLYSRHIYEGCGKSLACHNICPAGIDIEQMLVNSNAAAIWRNIFNRQRSIAK